MVNDGGEEALGHSVVDGAYVLFVVDVAILDELVGHDVVACLQDELVAQILPLFITGADFLEASIYLLELFGEI